MKDLFLEPGFDHARRRFARPEARDARLPRVVAGVAFDLRVDHVARNLDVDVLAGLVDVGELGLHLVQGTPHSALPAGMDGAPGVGFRLISRQGWWRCPDLNRDALPSSGS